VIASFQSKTRNHNIDNFGSGIMQQPKILIVEDNDLNLKLFYDLLIMKNYNVLTSKSGENALDLVRAELPDLILMDIQLNGISGTDIIRDLKSREETKNIPIIAITAFAMKHDEARIIQSGCDMYISKPVSIDNFYRAIDSFFVVETL
jgi:two-component system cell cycle response regulator DivK